jgi:hypothetical protein
VPVTVTAPDTETDTEQKQKKPSAKGKPSPQEIVLYQAYPRHTAPANAYRAIRKALAVKPFDELLLAVQAFCRKCSREGTEERFIPHPASWFNAGRYEDETFVPPALPLTQYQRDNPNWRSQ